MSKTAGYSHLALRLDKSSSTPLSHQIYREIAGLIRCGHIRPGERISSARQLSKDLSVSRNTVNAAYELLSAEGYIERAVGSGSSVSKDLPTDVPSSEPVIRAQQRKPCMSTRGLYFTNWIRLIDPTGAGSHNVGLPGLDVFPRTLWKRRMTHQIERLSDDDLGYGKSTGYLPLRNSIAEHLNQTRNINISGKQVIIVSDIQRGLDLIAQLLLDTADRVLFEDPGNPGARAALTAKGVSLVPVPVDREGINLSSVNPSQLSAKAIYVTPAHQIPLGITMSLARRAALLAWAEEFNGWIIEDESDHEYRYSGKVMPALASLDRHGRTIYIGTFSKTLYPGLKLGYVILPEEIAGRVALARNYMDCQSPIIDQATLAAFIAGGHYKKHIRKMRAIYAERRAAVIQAFQNHACDCLEITSPDTGTHIIATVRDDTDEQFVVEAFSSNGLPAMAISSCFMNAPVMRGVLASFANIRSDEIEKSAGTILRSIRGHISDQCIEHSRQRRPLVADPC